MAAGPVVLAEEPRQLEEHLKLLNDEGGQAEEHVSWLVATILLVEVARAHDRDGNIAEHDDSKQELQTNQPEAKPFAALLGLDAARFVVWGRFETFLVRREFFFATAKCLAYVADSFLSRFSQLLLEGLRLFGVSIVGALVARAIDLGDQVSNLLADGPVVYLVSTFGGNLLLGVSLLLVFFTAVHAVEVVIILIVDDSNLSLHHWHFSLQFQKIIII